MFPVYYIFKIKVTKLFNSTLKIKYFLKKISKRLQLSFKETEKI